MENIVLEMYEEFLMSEACSNYYAFGDEDDEQDAQNVLNYVLYMEHSELCKLAAQACINYIKTKNEVKFICELKKLDLNNNILIVKNFLTDILAIEICCNIINN